jgi:hypothetical protein
MVTDAIFFPERSSNAAFSARIGDAGDLILLVETPHDLAEDGAERVRRRLVALGEPSPAGSRISPREFGKEKLRFLGPSHPREITELNPPAIDGDDLADISVRACRKMPVDYCGRINRLPRYKTHDANPRNAT